MHRWRRCWPSKGIWEKKIQNIILYWSCVRCNTYSTCQSTLVHYIHIINDQKSLCHGPIKPHHHHHFLIVSMPSYIVVPLFSFGDHQIGILKFIGADEWIGRQYEKRGAKVYVAYVLCIRGKMTIIKGELRMRCYCCCISVSSSAARM